MVTKCKEWCFHIATLWGLGKWYGGGLVGSLFAIPLAAIFRVAVYLHKDFFMLLALLVVILVMVIIYLALRFSIDEPTSNIILDRVFGLFLVFLGNPLTIKFVLTGFILFHFVMIMRPFLFNRLGTFDIRQLSGVLGVMSSAIIAGVSVNLFFKVVMWLAQ